MASFGIKPNHMRKINIGNNELRLMHESRKKNIANNKQSFNLARVSGHAQTLLAEGDWCPPSCTAQCGQIVLSGTGNNVP